MDRVVQRRRRKVSSRAVPCPEGTFQDLILGANAQERAWWLLGGMAGFVGMEAARMEAEDVIMECREDGLPALSVTDRFNRTYEVPCAPVILAALKPHIEDVGSGLLWPEWHSERIHRALLRSADGRLGHRVRFQDLRMRFKQRVYEESQDMAMTFRLSRSTSAAGGIFLTAPWYRQREVIDSLSRQLESALESAQTRSRFPACS